MWSLRIFIKLSLGFLLCIVDAIFAILTIPSLVSIFSIHHMDALNKFLKILLLCGYHIYDWEIYSQF